MKLYDISALSVYSYDYQQDFIKPKRIYGIEISRLSIENYLSLKSPTVMRNLYFLTLRNFKQLPEKNSAGI